MAQSIKLNNDLYWDQSSVKGLEEKLGMLAKITGTSTVSDLNDLTATGIYYTNNATVNTPDSSKYLCVIVVKVNESAIRQVAFRLTAKPVFARYYSANDGWTPWDAMIAPVETATISGTLSGNTISIGLRKIDRTVHLKVDASSVSLTNATGSDTVATVPEEYRPANTIYITGLGRTTAAWANATYYPIMIRVQATGDVIINGNVADIKKCTYITVSGTYCVNNY